MREGGRSLSGVALRLLHPPKLPLYIFVFKDIFFFLILGHVFSGLIPNIGFKAAGREDVG